MAAVIARRVRLGQKSRRDRDWESHNRRQAERNTKFIWIFLRCEGGKPVKVNPPNRGCRGLGWVQSFEERRLRETKSHFWATLLIFFSFRTCLFQASPQQHCRHRRQIPAQGPEHPAIRRPKPCTNPPGPCIPALWHCSVPPGN